MARRALVVWVEASARFCNDSTSVCRHLGVAHLGAMQSGPLTSYCHAFGAALDDSDDGRALRHPDCLRAETFAGG